MSDNGNYYTSVRRILTALKPEALKHFERLTSDESRIEFVRTLGQPARGSGDGRSLVERELRVEHRHRGTSSSSHRTTGSGSKSNEEAKKSRQRGNELYGKGKLIQALECYTKSVLVAPMEHLNDEVFNLEYVDDGKKNQNQQGPRKAEASSSSGCEYALALGNRSACLLQLKRYDECLRDIDLALEGGYPKTLLYKLLDRRARALIETNRFTEAADTLKQLLEEALGESKLDSEQRTVVERATDKRLDFCTSAIVASKTTSSSEPPASVGEQSGTVAEQDKLPAITGSKNTRFPGASDAFDVQYRPDCGRYGVAKRNVNVGEILLVEPPYVSVLSPDQYALRCYNCFRSNVQVPIGCYGCSTVRYCSVTCRQKSWESSHRMECPYLDMVLESGTGVLSLLTVKLMLTAGIHRLLKAYDRKSNMNDTKSSLVSVNSGGVFVGGFSAAYELVGHSESRPAADLLQYTLLAIWITNILQASGYFDENRQLFTIVGSTVLRFLQIISCNGIDVMEMMIGESLDKSHPSTIGLGIYPTVSLLNHSCDPVADIVFYDDRCVLRAVQPIREGREMSISYGYVYYTTLIEPRRQALQAQYFFECHCPACTGNWRLKGSLPTGIPSIRCSYCGAVPQADVFDEVSGDVAPVECPECGVYAAGLVKKLGELEVSQGKAEQALKDARRMRIDNDGIAGLESHVTLLDSLMELPWKDYTVCMSGLKQCYSMLGNKRTAAVSKSSSKATC